MTAALRAEERAAPYLVAPLLTDQLDTFASAPEGFKRLRELVLNLAVRGRLVPQNPKDEPADKLLESIHGKPRAAPTECTAPFELPTVWRWVGLGDVLAKLSDGTHHSPPNGSSGPYMYVTAKNIKSDGIDLRSITYVSEEVHKEIFSRCNPEQGDILYIKDGATTGVTCINQLSQPFSMLSSVALLKPGLAVQSRFLLLVLRSPFFYSEVREGMTGVAITRVTLSRLRTALIPLPPLAEQSRIVAKVEELMALIAALEAKVGAGETARGRLLDALLAALADSPDAAATADSWAQLAPHFDLLLQTPADVDRLQQTLLQLAVKGRLVPQDPNDEPAAELLKRIRAEKERLVAEGKIKRDKPLPVMGAEEKPFQLPRGWSWVRMDEIAIQVTDGAHHTPMYVTEGVPFLSVKNLSAGALDFSDTRFVSETAHVELTKRCNPELGDILLTKIGTTGIAVVIDDPRPFSIFVSVALIKLPSQLIDRRYLALLINSPFVRKQSEDGTEGVGNKNLVLRKIKAFDLPIPPLPEQSRIVAAVASLTTLCDRLRERLATRRELSAKLAAALTESALA